MIRRVVDLELALRQHESSRLASVSLSNVLTFPTRLWPRIGLMHSDYDNETVQAVMLKGRPVWLRELWMGDAKLYEAFHAALHACITRQVSGVPTPFEFPATRQNSLKDVLFAAMLNAIPAAAFWGLDVPSTVSTEIARTLQSCSGRHRKATGHRKSADYSRHDRPRSSRRIASPATIV